MSRRATRTWAFGIASIAVCVSGVLIYRHFFKPHPTFDGIEAKWIAGLEGAISQFQADTGRFPTTAEGFQALMSAPANTAGWHGPYLMHFPHDHWNRPYIYRCPSVRFPQGFLILSTGPDGNEGTDDDVSNESLQEIMEDGDTRIGGA